VCLDIKLLLYVKNEGSVMELVCSFLKSQPHVEEISIMKSTADVYEFLCKSLGLKGGNNGNSALNGFIVLNMTKSVPREKFVDLLETFLQCDVELPEPDSSWIYFVSRTPRRETIGGGCMVQEGNKLTLCLSEV